MMSIAFRLTAYFFFGDIDVWVNFQANVLEGGIIRVRWFILQRKSMRSVDRRVVCGEDVDSLLLLRIQNVFRWWGLGIGDIYWR